MADSLTEILRAASKHPNSRVSKLIHTVEAEPSQKNIVLLLIELAEHAEYSTDFNVSLKYYLDLFEHLGINSDLVLNEAGLLLVNSSKIYSKRVDYVQSLVERQILTLSNADDELQRQKLEQQAAAENAATPAEKPKRSRKRALDAPTDPYEVELSPKKFKKLTEEKRFAPSKTPQKPKSLLRNIEMEQHIHPAGWQYATIYDLENEEDVDTKRNYKLFTYHVEHRYNTLVPDINFRLHFKVKDYIDEQEEMEAEDEACNTDRSWPPLSEAYVQKYLRLENYVLQQDLKAKKRKAAEIEVEEDEVEKSEDEVVARKESIDDKKNETQCEESLLDCSATDGADTTKENLDSTNLNGKNDSGLGQSILDETTTPLDSSNSENLNDTNSAEPNKSLNVTENGQENDSALGTSVLDQTGNTENNTTTESADNLDTSTNSENLNDTNTTEANQSQKENDSALGTSVLDQTGEATAENLDATTNSENLNETNAEEANGSLNATENDSALSNSVLDQTNSTETNTTLATEGETTAETSTILETSHADLNATEANDITTEASEKQGEDSTEQNSAELTKATENRKDSALSDDRHHSISTENLAISTENLNKIDEKTLQIDLDQEKDKDNNQLQVQLPHTDDEGVYLSDLEEHDCRMLSPIIKATNILPGVERKDVTIYMDDELRQALEMRDGIMEHFSHETYKVPVITEPKKQNLLFNILKLPEKIVRRKVIFKLGPEMDLYLQARSLKRARPEAPPRSTRTTRLLQWFSLNNTDMTGVCMTPPNSPGHCSDFCGFSDMEDDDDDTLSCAEFCGFTEEEQSTLMIKHNSRLSRDSGVGVDVNALTPEKEAMEIIFEEGESRAAIDSCKRILNLDQTPESDEPNTEALLNQLPEDIRDILTTELEGSTETPADESQKTDTQESCSQDTDSQNIEESDNIATESSLENSEGLSSENPSTNNTQESDIQLPENSTETLEESSESTVPLAASESQEASTETTANESQDKGTHVPKEADVEVKELEMAKDAEIKEVITLNADEANKSAEELLKEKLDAANSMDDSDNFDCQLDVTEDCDSDDEEMLDLDTQGTKTKIQQWHEHLQPILAKSRERHHFDVFKLGTEIIDTVQSRKQNSDDEDTSSQVKIKRPAASFHDIMDNKDTSYVSRYFLSTLLLANQSNIEISINNKSSEKPSSWHDIQLKLLSTKRHTVAIEDNIGMIDNKKKVSNKNLKEKPGKAAVQEKLPEAVDDEEEDEPLVKLQSSKKSPKKSKTSLKRSSDTTITSTATKKPKDITQSRQNVLPNLIESVQIIKSPQQVRDINPLMPSTSRQAQQQLLNTPSFNVNISNVRTLQPIEKVQNRSDDYDSGIFSVDEMSTS